MSDELFDDHIESMPEPSEHAIAAEAEEAQREEPASPDGFDPAIHQSDADGNPILNKDGSYRRKPGRKKGQGPKSQLNRLGADSKIDSVNAPAAEYRQAATATVDGVIALGMVLGGDAFAPVRIEGHDEREQGIQVWTRYYESRGISDIPPGVAVAVWSISYVGARVANSAEVRERFKGYWQKIKSLAEIRRKNKEPEKPEGDGEQTYQVPRIR